MSIPGRGVSPWRAVVIAIVAAAFAVALACGSDDEAEPTAAASGAASSGELVVYSGRSESLVDPIIEQFADATGINVQVKYGSTGELAATLLEEGDRSPADLFFAQDPGGLGAVESLLGTVPAETLALVPDWARSPEGKWVGISGRARVIVYNTEKLSPEDLPETIEGFTAPEWKGRIGWPPTNGSFQALVTGMRILWGEERTKAWIEGIQANDPKQYTNNTGTVQAVANGEVEVGFVNHYYLHRFLAEEGEGFKARNHYLSGEGPGSIILVAGAGILDSADNRVEAEQFLNFMLSTVGQQYFASQTYEHPLIEGVNTAREVQSLDGLTKPSIDISDLGDLEATQALLRDAGALP